VNSTATIGSNQLLVKTHVAFAAFILVSCVLVLKTIGSWFAYAMHHQAGSHIVLIPLVSLFLVFRDRQRVFSAVRPSFGAGLGLILAGAALYWTAIWGPLSQTSDVSLSSATLAILLIWAGGFIFSYGIAAARAAAFQLLFLLLMVPLPNRALDWTIRLLQEGSADVAYFLFNIVGVPVLRQGFIFNLPGVVIEVATECSGIRSSIALFITCLLAAHLYLRSPWKILIFSLLVFPLAVVKNGIRIVTLTLLSIYVNPGFLYGRLHRDGGFVFFLLALLLLFPVFTLLERSEGKRAVPASSPYEARIARE
jgi:exosortase